MAGPRPGPGRPSTATSARKTAPPPSAPRSAGLAKAGTPPKRLEVSAKVTFDKVGDSWTVVSSALDVRGEIPGAAPEKFEAAAEDAKENCPISRALKGNVKLSVNAALRN